MNWHLRFSQQVRWTRPLRDHLFQSIDLVNSRHILEVGCGTGALLQEIEPLSQGNIYGLDIDGDFLHQAAANSHRTILLQGDAHDLPFPDKFFNLALCHFLLLWIKDPCRAVAEMRRVVRSSGYILALAEPDYGGRMDYPVELSALGKIQRESLESQGANPLIGRKLADIFKQAGLVDVQVGLLGGEWMGDFSADEWELEWAVFERDLACLPANPERIKDKELKQLDLKARQRGVRILYVPTFYGVGRVQ